MSKGSKELLMFEELMNEYIHDYSDDERVILANRWLMMYYNDLKRRKKENE